MPEGPQRHWTYFAVAAASAATVSVALAAFIIFHPLGYPAVTAVDDIGEAVAALIAAGACALASRQTIGRLRLAWTLVGLASASWGIGEVVWCVYEVGMGIVVPFPSLADVGFLGMVPLAVAGILAFWTAPRGTSTRGRAWLDGTIVALALTVVAWSLGLKEVFLSSGDTLFSRLIGTAYPIGDIFVITVLVLAIRRATRQQQGRMLHLLGGLAAISVADSAFVYLNAANAYGVTGNVLDVGWVAGFLMIALAAIWPSARTDIAAERAPIDVWQVALPWMAVVGAVAAVAATLMTGKGPETLTVVTMIVLLGLVMVSQVITQRDSVTTIIKSQRAEATLADVIVHAPAGVVRLGADLRIQVANPRFNTLLRAGDGTLIGRPITQFLSESEVARAEDKFRALNSGVAEAVELEVEGQRVDGTKAWLHWSATVVLKADGSTDYFIAMVEDMTLRHEEEAAAAASLAVLERLNQIKSSFLHNVSHEFRTSLTGIQGFSELLRDSDELNLEEVKSFARDIYRDADRLDRMVTEMLDLDRVETSRATMKLASIDINDTIRHAVEARRTRLDGITIDATLDPALPGVMGDREKLADVVQTLIDNALRYSPDSGLVTVTSRIKGLDIEVVVADQGTGVRSDFDKRLFGQDDLYANNPIRKVVGTGLGLGIARHVVEMHGGRIWADRLEDKGSEIHFTIPALVPDQNGLASEPVGPTVKVA